MPHEHGKLADNQLTPGGNMPFSDCSLFVFDTPTYPEGILHINREGGILISCDSIKNWTEVDPFFSPETGKLYQHLGFMGTATISKIWQQACQVQAQDFARLKTLSFKHLLSAHGEPFLYDADKKLALTIKQEFNI